MENNLLLPLSDDIRDLIALRNIETTLIDFETEMLEADFESGCPALQSMPAWYGKHFTEMTDQEIQEAGDAGYFSDAPYVNPAEMTDEEWDAYQELGS